MPFVQAKCPECGGMLAVDDSKKAAVCQFCSEAFIVQEAINNFNTYNTYNTNHNYGEGAVVNVYEDKDKDFVIEAGILKEYHGASVDVVIPEGVYEISSTCFNGMKIKSMTLPASLQNLNDIEESEIFNTVELNAANSHLKLKNDIIYSANEFEVEAFIGCQKEYFLSEKVTQFSNTAKRQLKNIKHLYCKSKDLLEINCNELETINQAKNMGLVPFIKHDLVEYKCKCCHKYVLDSCRKEWVYYGGFGSTVSINFIDDEKVALSINTISNLNSIQRIEEFSSKIKTSTKEKLAKIKTLIILNLNEYNRAPNKFVGLYEYSDSMTNLLNALFPNIENIIVEEDTRYYDDIQEKQISLFDNLIRQFINEKILNNSVAVSYNKNLPMDTLESVKKVIEFAEEHKKQKQIEQIKKAKTDLRNKGLCQYCGGELKGLFSKKCVKCGKPKDY